MFENHDIKIIFQEPNCFILQGKINEHFPLELASQMTMNPVILNFSEVKNLNSIGIMKFINFLGNLATNQHVFYEDLPAHVLSQMVLVKGLLTRRFQLKSVLVPFVGMESDEVVVLKIHTHEIHEGKLPQRKHPETGEGLEPDVSEERLFRFMVPSDDA